MTTTMNNANPTTNLREYLETRKQDLVHYLYENEKETALDFLEYGLNGYYDTFADAVMNYAGSQTTHRKETALKWLEEHYHEIDRITEEAISREYINLKNFSFCDVLTACQQVANDDLLFSLKGDLIDCYALDFLIQSGYEIVDDEFLLSFLARIDEEHLTDWDLQNALEETIENPTLFDFDEDEE